MNKPKFSLGELVLYCDGIFFVRNIRDLSDKRRYCIGKTKSGQDFWVDEDLLKPCDWRDIIRITKTQKV